jgi:hypothetical protein
MNYEPRTPQEVERVRQGKEGKLWRIEVLFYVNERVELKRYEQTNLLTDEMMKFRERVFAVGVMVPVSPGHFIIAPPWEIREINLYKQDRFFDP